MSRKEFRKKKELSKSRGRDNTGRSKRINTKGKVLDEKRRLQPFRENMVIEGRIMNNSKKQIEIKRKLKRIKKTKLT